MSWFISHIKQEAQQMLELAQHVVESLDAAKVQNSTFSISTGFPR